MTNKKAQKRITKLIDWFDKISDNDIVSVTGETYSIKEKHYGEYRDIITILSRVQNWCDLPLKEITSKMLEEVKNEEA